jgi:hypothetical protein
MPKPDERCLAYLLPKGAPRGALRHFFIIIAAILHQSAAAIGSNLAGTQGLALLNRRGLAEVGVGLRLCRAARRASRPRASSPQEPEGAKQIHARHSGPARKTPAPNCVQS